MSYALQGSPPRGATLTEQANSQRLCRSMFIGHGIAYVIVFAVIASLAQTVIVWLETGLFAPQIGLGLALAIDTTIMPPLVYVDLLPDNLIASTIILALQTLVWLDLIVRRRHDRGASGIDGMLFLALLIATQLLYVLGAPRQILAGVNLALYALALYLFVVLVLLPGDRGENRYGARPRPT